MKYLWVAVALVIATFSVQAQQAENPIHYTWIVTSTADWNEAMSALVVANGDPGTIIVPAGMNEKRWLILRRVIAGSVYVPETEIYGCEVYKTIGDASDRSVAMHSCHSPLVMNVPDGGSVVLSLKQCAGTTTRRRAVK